MSNKKIDMKRIGIVTITGSIVNYGNQLQNYAVQKVLQKMEYNAETIYDVRWVKNPILLWSYWKSIIHLVTRYKYSPVKHKKSLRFFFWNRKYIKHSPIVIHSIDDEQKLLCIYDGFVVGSDQIWGPTYISELAFLDFAPKNLRVAYCPSFGISDLPNDKKAYYSKSLNTFSALSVRENQGREIIKDLIGREASVLIDPTMMLDKQEWDKIAVSSPMKEFILVYLLGESSITYENYIYDIAKKNNLEIIDLTNHPKFSASNPSEFIGLIRESQMVITDSFHGAVFSLLYHKDLVLLDRIGSFDMSSRMQTLWDKFQIKPQKIINGIYEVKNTNWCEFEYILEEEREKASSFLSTSIQI